MNTKSGARGGICSIAASAEENAATHSHPGGSAFDKESPAKNAGLSSMKTRRRFLVRIPTWHWTCDDHGTPLPQSRLLNLAVSPSDFIRARMLPIRIPQGRL